MHTMPQLENLPRNFYFRVIAIRGSQVSEIVHLPGGLVLTSSEGLGQGLLVSKEESRSVKVKHSRNEAFVGAMH